MKYVFVLTLTYDFLKYDNTFLQNTTRSMNTNTFFVEYDWQKGKYAHTWSRATASVEYINELTPALVTNTDICV